jgi:hypothetical protein
MILIQHGIPRDRGRTRLVGANPFYVTCHVSALNVARGLALSWANPGAATFLFRRGRRLTSSNALSNPVKLGTVLPWIKAGARDALLPIFGRVGTHRTKRFITSRIGAEILRQIGPR